MSGVVRRCDGTNPRFATQRSEQRLDSAKIIGVFETEQNWRHRGQSVEPVVAPLPPRTKHLQYLAPVVAVP